ncbi:13057_t:CDS:2, partial [Ambispora leptoticha]
NKETTIVHAPLPSTSTRASTINKTIQSIVNIIKPAWLSILLVFIPLGIISYYLHWGDASTFSLNFLAIIPLAKLLGTVTEDIALRISQKIGGLLKATFENAVELIVSISAIRQGLIRVVQASILGSIISNLLLVLGMFFLVVGYHVKEYNFNQTAAQTRASLMTLACIALIIPTALHANADKNEITQGILNLSHGTAVVLLIVYAFYLYFQLKTHKYLHNEIHEDAELEELEEREEPQLSLSISVALSAVITVAIAFCGEFLVSSIEGISETSGLSKTFVGLILIPIVSNVANAAEHMAAVSEAKGDMDLIIGAAVGSSI